MTSALVGRRRTRHVTNHHRRLCFYRHYTSRMAQPVSGGAVGHITASSPEV